MKIFALYYSYYNGCDGWDSLLAVYRNEDDAIEHLLREEEAEYDPNHHNWSVKELEVY